MSKSIMQDRKHCYVTGRTDGLHKHHVFGGPNRRLAEEDGLYIWLRWDRHIENSPYDTPHNNKSVDLFYKREGQRAYEKTHNREEFMQRYGRNWLDETDNEQSND